MKALLVAGVASLFALTAMAAAKGLTASQAQDLVIKAAHHYISVNAPDWGGKVKSPCSVNLNGDQYSVSCTGEADETTAGDGSVKIDFACDATFVQGQGGLFYQNGKT